MSPRLRWRRPIGLVAAIVMAGALTGAPAAAEPLSLGPENPFMARGGVGSVHNDAESSNATPQPGPGTHGADARLVVSGTACPTILLDRAGLVVAYCFDDPSVFRPSLRLLDPRTLAVLTSLPLPPTGPFAVYLYLDRDDRAVVATGAGHVLRVAHRQNPDGRWSMSVADDWDVGREVTAHCGGSTSCDYIVSVKPDWTGRIWFSTAGGVLGVLDPSTGTARAVQLPAGEQVTKAISASPGGVAVASDHALYLFRAQSDGTPQRIWREPYERGGGVKPGQLTDGTGTAPTFFGPDDDRYVTIMDNAVPQERVLVYRVDGHERICAVPVFQPGASATENTSIGAGRTIVASNTSGYDFFDPTAAKPMAGGLARVDVRPDGSGCDLRWSNALPSDSVPKLSVRDDLIYGFQRTVTDSTATYSLVAIDPATGRIRIEQRVGDGPAFETLQLPPMAAPDGTLYQSTVAGIIRVTPVR